MGKVEKIEQDIEMLSKSELKAFRRWFQEYDAQAWDQQIEADANSGKLDRLAKEAIGEYRSGKASEL